MRRSPAGIRPNGSTSAAASASVLRGREGPPLLLIHGYGGAAWNFAELAPLLPGRRLLIPDLPGHGASAPLPATPTLAGVRGRARAPALRARAGRRRRPLARRRGRAAARRTPPELVRRLVLAAPPGSRARRGSAGRDHARRDRAAGADRRRGASSAIARSPAPATARLRQRPRGRRTRLCSPSARCTGFLRGPTLHTDTLGAGLALGARRPAPGARPRPLPGARPLGRPRPQVPVEDGFEYARRLRAPIRVIADCGHLLIGERPEVCARAILEFLR